MAKLKFNTNKIFKIALIVYAAVFVVGTVLALIPAWGVKMDINFSGGTRISYSYTGDISLKDFEAAVSEKLKSDFTVSENTSIAGDTKTVSITLVGKKSLEADTQKAITTVIEEKFPDNKFELYDSTSVSPTIAGTFLAKSLVAVLITAVLVVIYVGIRFKKIGGVSAAITALAALVLDVLVTFFTCVIFKLQIDSNFIAVVLTMLGYSLNDTIVIYDRVRENRRLYPELGTAELVDSSINSVATRNFVTTITTLLAVLTIVVVAEIYGLTTLRTFAIPMAFGLVSGCLSSLFVSGPLWVIWKNHSDNRKKAKKV